MFGSARKILPIYLFVDLMVMCICFVTTYAVCYGSHDFITLTNKVPYVQQYALIYCLWMILIVLSFRHKALYVTDRSVHIPQEVFTTAGQVIFVSIVIGAIIFFAQYKFFSRKIFVCTSLALLIFLPGWRVVKRLILRQLIAKGFHNINVLIVGAGRIGTGVLEEIKRKPWMGFRVVGFLDDSVREHVHGVPVLGSLFDFDHVVKQYFIHEVIVTIPSEKNVIDKLIEQARRLHLGVRMVPQNFEQSLPILSISYLGFIPLITYKERQRNATDFLIKRVFDIFIVVVLLVVLMPLFAAIAIAIKCTSKGSVFFVQKRAGQQGRPFNFYKFRSMVADAEALKQELMAQNEVKDGIIFKIKKDPRITGIGRFLRRYSLDELPQLFNVLKGDMSLVGPRPPTLDEVEKYTHEHMQRLSLRPGITGLSQVRGRSELTFRKWVRWDIWYVNNWTFTMDLLILLWTVPAVFKGRGAY